MRHFIYQDEKSHKFWAVEQQGNELHINWGKVGTNGQMLQQTCISPPSPKPLLKLKLPLRVKTNARGWLMMQLFR